MSEPQITLDPRGLSPVEQKLQGPLEEQLTSALQAAAERVRADYAGEPLPEVTRRLMAETRSGLHPDIAAAFQPNPDDFQRVAEAIVRGDIG